MEKRNEIDQYKCRDFFQDEWINVENVEERLPEILRPAALHIAGFRMHFDKVVRKFNETGSSSP